MEKNEVYASTQLQDEAMWQKEFRLSDPHWINDAPDDGEYRIRVRHRAPLVPAALVYDEQGVLVRLSEPQRAVAAGQSIVVYASDDECLGGGIIR